MNKKWPGWEKEQSQVRCSEDGQLNQPVPGGSVHARPEPIGQIAPTSQHVLAPHTECVRLERRSTAKTKLNEIYVRVQIRSVTGSDVRA